MSGETRGAVSGWTVDTLKHHVDSLFEERDKRYEERFKGQEKAVAAAEREVDKWQANANEWRGAMDDREIHFVGKAENQAISERFESEISSLRERADKAEGRTVGRHSAWLYGIGALAAGSAFLQIATYLK